MSMSMSLLLPEADSGELGSRASSGASTVAADTNEECPEKSGGPSPPKDNASSSSSSSGSSRSDSGTDVRAMSMGGPKSMEFD
jgi:hypothetical protein